MKVSIYDYLDYRVYLQDWMKSKKAENSAWSHRMISEKIGLKSSGHLSLIINGKTNLTENALEGIVRLFKLHEAEANYFRNLVLYNQAKNHLDQKNAYERLLSSKDAKITVLEANQYSYYSRWYYSAVREALNIIDFKGSNFLEFGDQMIPALNSSQVKEAFDFLKKQNLIHQNDKGFWKSTSTILSTGKQQSSMYFNEHIIQILELAKCAIQRIPTGEKYSSWITMSIGQDSFDKIVDELRETRMRILKIVEKDSSPQRIFHLNLNIFPFTQKRMRRSL